MPLSFTGLSLFEAYVEKVMRAYDACGMAVAIVDQGQPVQELFYGFRDGEQKLPINQDTIFGLASVTKSFTCLAILHLAQQGKIDLDAPVSQYIPSFHNSHREKTCAGSPSDEPYRQFLAGEAQNCRTAGPQNGIVGKRHG